MTIRHAGLTLTVTAAVLGFGSALASPSASAQPDLSPLIQTTCDYQQVEAALNTQAPDLARELAQYPAAQAKLQRFLTAPPSARQQMVDQAFAAHPQWQNTINEKAGTPQGQQTQSALLAVANTCNSY